MKSINIFSEVFVNLLKIKKYESTQLKPLGSYYSLKSPLVWAISLANVDLRIFPHSSLQIPFKLRLNEEHCCNANFRFLLTSSIKFISWLWLKHWRAFTNLSQSHSCILLAVFIWVTVVFEGETLPKAVILSRFCSRIYFDLFIFFSTLTSLPVLAA